MAAFLVAGGQGTRLGFDGPKGAYEIGPVTRRTLFQLHAEKIAALSRRAGKTVPWYIMTSESNHNATVAYFREHAFHGLREDSVRFFRQDMLPAVDRAGKFLLETKSRVFTSPNGHGGSLKALRDSGALADMKERGIDVIFYFQVDNPLVEICDPVFLGRHLEARADMSSKVVRKSSWKEKVGVMGLLGGKLAVIEYSDLPEAAARAVLPDGSLEYWAGSIAIHVLSADFVDRLTRGGFHLPYHRAEKAIPHVDASGREVKPSEKNGIKFETFVFNALAEARNSVTMEVLREEEFSPVKNAEGEDSPATSRRDLTALYLRWLEENGASIERDQGGRLRIRRDQPARSAAGVRPRGQDPPGDRGTPRVPAEGIGPQQTGSRQPSGSEWDRVRSPGPRAGAPALRPGRGSGGGKWDPPCRGPRCRPHRPHPRTRAARLRGRGRAA